MEENKEVTVASEMPPMPLVALTPVELAATQSTMIEWCDRKMAEMRQEQTLLTEGFHQARKRKWKISGWITQIELCEQRIRFYGKCRFALEKGYLIIPDLPVNVFAVRTDATEPPYHLYRNKPRINSGFAADVPPNTELEVGEGKYVAPVPKTARTTRRELDYKNLPVDVEYFRACGIREMQFPVALAQVKVIDATRAALALRVFDEVGLIGPARNADPIVVGKILDPRQPIGNHAGLTFFIAWWFNWEML